MPRNPGTGVYEQPSPDVITATTIESAVYNGFVNDVETDLNAPRPVVAGGTGANNATTARDNLDCEVALQTVTNYSTQVWENGSFYSAPGSTGGPANTHHVIGTFYGGDQHASMQARDISVAGTAVYSRLRQSGVWTAWALDETTNDTHNDARYVNLTGDVMTGNLAVTKASAEVKVGTPDTTTGSAFSFASNIGLNWQLSCLNSAANNDFAIGKYSGVDGSFQGFPLRIDRVTNRLTMSGDVRISKSEPGLYLNKFANGEGCSIWGHHNDLARWLIAMGENTSETGGNLGSNFGIYCYADGGAFLSQPVSISRATGNMTVTGDLSIDKVEPALTLTKTASGQSSSIWGKYGVNNRWLVTLGEGTAEAGSNAGSDFGIYRYADNGAFLERPFGISRATGKVSVLTTTASTSNTTGALTVAGGLGVAGNYHGAGIGIGVTAGTFPGAANTNTGVDIGSGYVMISAASGNAPLFVNRNNDGAVFDCRRSGANVGNISVTTTATAFNTSSDARLKEDLKSFDAGNIIDDTKVYDFKWKDTSERAYGVIAQEAVGVYATPTFHDEKADRWFVDYSKYVPVILQELKALRARVAELEGRLEGKPA